MVFVYDDTYLQYLRKTSLTHITKFEQKFLYYIILFKHDVRFNLRQRCCYRIARLKVNPNHRGKNK